MAYTEEDDRIHILDDMYLQEQRMQEEEEYFLWEQEEEKLPAKISILLPILKSETK